MTRRPPLFIRACLHAFAPEARAEYGPEFVALMQQRLALAARGGRAAVARYKLSAGLDALAVAWRNRVLGGDAPDPSELPPELPIWTLDMLLQDLKFGIRTLVHRPWFAAAVILTLAVGIGANTLIYTAVDNVVLNPFDMPDPDRVVLVGTEYPRLGQPLGFFEVLSGPEYADIVRESQVLSAAAGFDMGNRQIMGGDVPQNAFTAFWWADPLPVLGLQPIAGRSFSPQDVRDSEAVAMISERVWRSRFAADEGVVGGTIRINDDPYVLIGIFPAAANIYGTDLWTPMWVDPEEMPRGQRRQFNLVGRLDDGRSLAEFNAELEGMARRTELEYGSELDEYAGWKLRALTFSDALVRTMKPAAMVLLGAVGFVLLLVCANVASLLLSRSAGRQREIGVRMAVGAGRMRVIRQLLAESMIVATAGALLGLAVSWFGTLWLQANIPSNLLPTTRPLGLNGRVLLYTGAITVLSGILFGLAPALHTARVDVQRVLGSGSVGGSRGRRRLHDAFVAVEIALALVLLSGAGLFMTGLGRLQSIDAGFEPDRLLTMRLTLPQARYQGDAVANFFTELAERAERVPGVSAAASASQYPPREFFRNQFSLPDTVVGNDSELPVSLTTIASADYFETMEIPLRAGRTFNNMDRAGDLPAAVVNEAFARRFLDGDAVDKRVKLGRIEDDSLPWLQIVGVVGDTRNNGLQNDPSPEMFVNVEQVGGVMNQLFMVIRTEDDPRAVLPGIREAVAAMDPDQPIYAIATMRESMASGFAIEGFAMLLLTVFAAIALVLASTGIFGVVAYSVSQRSREIGVRMALGAGVPEVRRLVVRQALLPVAIGAAAGLALSIGAGVAFTGFLTEIKAFEPVPLAAVALTLTVVAGIACYLPARRASRIDPVLALRTE